MNGEHRAAWNSTEVPEEILDELRTTIVPTRFLPPNREGLADARSVFISDDAELTNQDGTVIEVLESTLVLNILLLTNGAWANKETMRDYGHEIGNKETFKQRLQSVSAALANLTGIQNPVLRSPNHNNPEFRLDEKLVFCDRRPGTAMGRYRKRTQFYYSNLAEADGTWPLYESPAARQQIFANMLRDFQDNPDAQNYQRADYERQDGISPQELSVLFAAIDTALAAYLCEAPGKAEQTAIMDGIGAYNAIFQSCKPIIERFSRYFSRSFQGHYDDLHQSASADVVRAILEADVQRDPKLPDYFQYRIMRVVRGSHLNYIKSVESADKCLAPYQYNLFKKVGRAERHLQSLGEQNPAAAEVRQQALEMFQVDIPEKEVRKYLGILHGQSPAFSLDYAIEADDTDTHEKIPDVNAEALLDYQIDQSYSEDALAAVFGPGSGLSDYEKIALSLRFQVYSTYLYGAELTIRDGNGNISGTFTYPSTRQDFYELLRDESIDTFEGAGSMLGVTTSGMSLAVRRALGKARSAISVDDELHETMLELYGPTQRLVDER